MQISKAHARRFLLAHQSLLPPRSLQGKAGILAYIRRVGCIQYDPLNITGNNTDLVLQARVSDYRPKLLGELLYQERKLVDGWDKNMSIYPVEDWPNFRRWREGARSNLGENEEAINAILPLVRQTVEERGPICSLDLEIKEVIRWDWDTTRLARAVLDTLYYRGELVIHHRVHTRKFYDFAHRLLPLDLLEAPEPNPTEEAYHDWYVHRRIGSVGLLWNRAGEAWLGMGKIKSLQRKASLLRLIERGEILQVAVEGIPDPFYCRAQDAHLLEQTRDQDLSPQAAFLAPLDNLLWDRRLLKELFDFDYLWEVYVPAAKRRYGYYVLPVLFGDRFIARFEPVIDRPQKLLTIKNWWWEKGVNPSAEIKVALQDCLHHFKHYLGASNLEVSPEANNYALQWLTT